MAINQILSIPSNSNGLSPVSGGSAWGYGSWVVFTTSLPSDGYITGFTFQNQAIPSLDTTQQFLFEVGIGASGAEVVKLQVPYSFRQDTVVGIYLQPVCNIYFPEPFFVHGGSVISVRVADSIASALTYNNTKLMYRDAGLPTTVLNSPADAGTTTSLTPALNFTGTDVNGDALEYEVQVDTANTFDSQEGSETLITSHPESNFDGEIIICGDPVAYNGAAQAFTATALKLSKVKFWLNKVLSPTGNAVAKLYAIIGTFGTNAIPTGTALAVSDNVDVSTIGTSFSLISFTFSGENRYQLVNGTNYAVTFEYSGGDLDNHIKIGIDGTQSTYTGNVAGHMTTWVGAAYDSLFYVYGVSGGALIDAVSTTDAGFTAGHPFASGVAKEYTFQSNVALDTYYWRVRAKDPTGANAFGDWSATRSFEVIAGGFISIKSLLGLATVSVKSLNSKAIADVKSKNGLN